MSHKKTKNILFSIPLIAFCGLLQPACMIAAPPIRSGIGSFPQLREPGQTELSASARVHTGGPETKDDVSNGWKNVSGGLSLNLALTERVQIEFGGDVNPSSPGGWVMGWGGFRFPIRMPQKGLSGFAMDLELGVGGGVGGALDCVAYESDDGLHFSPSCSEIEMDNLSWYQRSAFGGYLGTALAYNWEFVSWALFRYRFTISGATNIPMTFWNSIDSGLSFKLSSHLRMSLSGGFQAFRNRLDDGLAAHAELGLTVIF